jgi:hypothetical protein
MGERGRRVIVEPFVFTAKSKSDLGWTFVVLPGGRRRQS